MVYFRLSDEFIKSQSKKQPKFGFEGLGYLTYLRTYARVMDNEKLEKWSDTIRRVTEGCYNIQKEHIIKTNNSVWNETKGQNSAQQMYKRMFEMKFLPPGRGLWAMGTKITNERKLFTSLNNCAMVSTANIANDYSKPFTFLMDVSMLGVGTGFDTKGQGKISINLPKNNWKNQNNDNNYDFESRCGRIIKMRNTQNNDKEMIINQLSEFLGEYIDDMISQIKSDKFDKYCFTNLLSSYLQMKIYIDKLNKIKNDEWNNMLYLQLEDSRDGWVDALDMLLRSYFMNNLPMIIIDYSLIRKKGIVLSAFGGLSSGPLPLVEMVIKITSILEQNYDCKMRVQELCLFVNDIKIIAKQIIYSVTDSNGNPNCDDSRYANNNMQVNSIVESMINDFNNEINKLHNQNCDSDHNLCLITERTIVDIMNLAGKAVVSGNIRRTAEIALGEPNNEFMGLKDYSENPERCGYSWTSNNSVFGTVGMDYTKIAEKNKYNGEPGIFYLDNARKYGRLIDEPNYLDIKAVGCNPCGEQTLESYEMCCLVEIFIDKHLTIDKHGDIVDLNRDLEDFLETLKYTYLYAKTVTLCKSHWPETNSVQLRNRRIGTSLTSIQQFKARLAAANNIVEAIKISDEDSEIKLRETLLDSNEKNGDLTSMLVERELIRWCETGYKKIKYYDDVYSDYLAVPRSIKCTTIKPSGCVTGDTLIKIYNPSVKDKIITVPMQELINDWTDIDIYDEENKNISDYWINMGQKYDVGDEKIYVINDKNEIELITNIYLKGMSDVYEVIFEDGTSVRCTPEHKFKSINNEWIETQNIKVGDSFQQSLN